ncbi:hypothetical protein Pme01_21500 [Planosporangium mesophilum]|uniref:Uncharacterized protein n=2 Tax=Planosporangium mesophilum TaxID=689768 RepID=A0A8J3T9X4_9ACTN|nr:hypothetical protein Pme01_21500 [Planosporangium mesophilum]
MVSVAAVVLEESPTVLVRAGNMGANGYAGYLTGRVQTKTRLAAMLAPPARLQTVTAPAVCLGVAVFLEFVMLSNLDPARSDFGAVAGFASLLGLVIAALTCVILVRKRKLSASGPIAERARALWRRCWYCRRCGVVTLAMTGGSNQTLPAHGLARTLVAIARTKLH